MLTLLRYFLVIVVLILTVSQSSCSFFNPENGNSQVTPISTTDETNRYKINLPAASGGRPFFNIQANSTFAGFPDKVQVYKLIKPEITAAYTSDIAAELGLTGKVEQGPDEFYIQNGSVSVEVFKATGAIFYTKDIPDPKEKPTLPSDDEAIIFATQALSKIGQLPAGYKGVSKGVGYWSDSWPINLLISFKENMNIDGKPLIGPGAKYGVRVGEGGEIQEILINPVKYELQDTITLKSPAQAFQELRTTGRYLAPSQATRANIDITLAYWLEPPLNTEQDYIAPVYYFTGKCYDALGNQLTDGFEGYVEAQK